MRRGDPGQIVERGDPPESDVLPRGHLVLEEVLEDDADVAAQVVQVVLLDRVPVDQDLTGCRLVQPGQQLDQGGLACAVVADDGAAPARRDHAAETVEGLRVGARVDERDVAELDPVPQLGGEPPVAAGYPRFGQGEEVEEVPGVERVLVEPGESSQQARAGRADRGDGLEESGQLADRAARHRREDGQGDRAHGPEHADQAGDGPPQLRPAASRLSTRKKESISSRYLPMK